jgi:hypothetical protein
MRILFVTYFFPPYNVIGAVRTGKIAKYLHLSGVDIKVITAKNPPLPVGLPLEIPQDRVIATSWIDVNTPAIFLSGMKKSSIAISGFPRASGVKKLLIDSYKNIVHFPDAQIGWLWAAEKAASEIIEQQRPDLIYASASPYTSLLVASRLSKKYGIPWFGELRDLWMDNHNIYRPWLRQKMEAILERSVLSSAKGLVSVSEQLVETLSNRYKMPTKIIKNGYDESDYEDITQDFPEKNRNKIQISYMGSIYEGKQDPSVIFEAIGKLGQEKKYFFINFYGRYNKNIISLAQKYDIEDQIKVHEVVNFKESLRIQKNSDILLLLTWDSPSDYGVYTGKFFEYLASKRPIIALGNVKNVALNYVAQNDIGYAGNQVKEIVDYLQNMLQLKRSNHFIPNISHLNLAEFSRYNQVQDLLNFLRENYA